MNQIEKSLIELFQLPLKDGSDRKIIFWNDYEEEFKNDFEKIEISEVKIVHLKENNQFYIKHLLEEEDLVSSYLIYTNINLQDSNNWLFDTVLYSQTFYADRISLIMNELNMEHTMRETIQRYQSFFNNKARFIAFKNLEIHTYTKEKIEIAMMNVICRTRSIDFESVLRTVLMDTLVDKDNRFLKDFESYFDVDTFWAYVAREYDYKREEKSLQTLFIHLAMTAFSRSIAEKHLSNYGQFIAENNKTNAYVFIDHWMHHKSDYKIYNGYIVETENKVKLQSLINSLSIEDFSNAEIFPYIDRAIIIYIINSLLDNQEDYDDYIELISARRSNHFFEQYKNKYEALLNVVKMFAFKKQYDYGIPQGNAIHAYEGYVNEYYLMDTYYRKFYVAYDTDEDNEVLYKLRMEVEKLYTNWFMGELSNSWSQNVQTELKEDWTLPGIRNQQEFFRNTITPHIDKNERSFIIISDALRYEVGVELQARINSEIMGSCELDTMLGVIPSVTKLGMAALLPHRTLTFDDQANVLVNNQSSSGIANRKKIIESHTEDSIAIHFDELLQSNKAARRDLLIGKKVIYIYHDTIDAVGDNADTEINTFDGVEQAIDQLSNLVRIIRNDLSGTHVYITADHGFLYQREPLEVTDLMNKESISNIETKRRYILSNEEKEVIGQAAIDLSSIVSNEPKLFAYVPHATMRYRIQGGGRNFVHGGASLQEVVIPLLSIKNKRADQKGAQKIEKVDINLTSTTRRITNSIFTLDFFQNERVADKRIARTVLVSIVDESGNVFSNEETIIGDLTETNPKERMFKISFALKNLTYDRTQTYYLVVKDVETDVVTERVPFTINLGFVSDFDF